MRQLLLIHGKNDWNLLPESGVDQELEDVRSGSAVSVVIEDDPARRFVGSRRTCISKWLLEPGS